MASRCGSALIMLLTLSNVIHFSFSATASTGNFDTDFLVTWSSSHVNTSVDRHSRTLKLDLQSGSAFASKYMFLFGQIDMQIKLISGYSAGTVVAYYLSSNQSNRDEIDFEFLGKVLGQPYIVQTNIYVDGYDNREERICLWFDPTVEFHTYSILWNIHQIVFMVDWVPIRVYRNHGDKGVAFPMRQPMSLELSLWNGESWATRGGLDKIDWSKGPFLAIFRNYKINACVWNGNPTFCGTDGNDNWWNKPNFSGLTFSQRRLLRWVRKYYLIYDYCNDPQRFQGRLPRECSLSNFF
ncbi:putative xyloglucan endotransglucosylase/hydrolase protein 10 [Platanthera zijinensis]|uniref:Xyloglucan endotransglucosylase/hydrolase n=1 Tax=Platanthera zijinensis TaxID=2320716 RepID=A0AAP0B1X8_9ASPA